MTTNPSMELETLVSFQSVSFSYRRETSILDEISFDLFPGQSLAVIGESGLGKTTLLKLADASILPTKGRVVVCGQETGKLSRSKRLALRRNNLGLVFQNPRLLPELSLLENVTLPALLTKSAKTQAVEKAHELLDQFRVDTKLQVSELSGGQACRVAVARALITNPKLIIADEPTASLDPQLAQAVLSLLLEYCHEKTALLLVTHNFKIAKRCSRAIELLKDTDSNCGARLKEQDITIC